MRSTHELLISFGSWEFHDEVDGGFAYRAAITGKDGVVARLTIPVQGIKPLKAGLARQLLKIAGLSEDDL